MREFLSLFTALLPMRYRRAFFAGYVSQNAAVASGVLQTLLATGLLIARFLAFMNGRLATVSLTTMLKAGERGGETMIMSLGPIFYFEYVLRPLSLVLLYLGFEGIARAGAAIASGEVVPNLFLKLIELAHARLGAEMGEAVQGRRVIDEVERSADGGELRIASCRRKPWNTSTTISYQDELYEMVAEEKGAAPRPFVYLLRKNTSMRAIHGICAYDPRETLQRK